MKKLLLLYSGGTDSTVLLYLAKQLKYDVTCLLFDYGQNHIQEIEHAVKICTRLGVSYQIVKIGGKFLIKSNLTANEKTYDGVSPFYVPFRNTIFISIAAAVAESNGVNTIWIGINYEDRINLFPDCTQEWVYKVNELLTLNSSFPINLEAPLMGFRKETINEIFKTVNTNDDKTFSGYGTEK